MNVREKKTILIIDDNADHLELHKIILKMANYEVFTAQSGALAFSILSEIKAPDLILLDLRMEDMSGLQFLQMLEERRPEIIQNVPVVFLSAMDEVPESKATGFIRKPTDMNQFIEEVRRYIEAGTPKREISKNNEGQSRTLIC